MHPASLAIADEDFFFGLHPFRLFCIYHLGLDDEGNASFRNGQQAARALQVSLDQMNEALEAYRMSAETLLHSDFDLASAQADISVSPPGVDLNGLAEMHFAAFLQAKENGRDWDEEAAQDASANGRLYD
ncbi:MAG: DUF1481 domain-containing protein [Deltaproteobacteria bacterium]|nr:DUF1481 domain-containing protein [Deltaproteobacteria bacterium]